MKRVSVTMNTRRRGQDGFALILALLALMLLTSLGLSLSTTTSTELQIATNHRWSEQARYNAEAGLEFGKQFLTTINNWESILPPARVAGSGWPANQPVVGPRADALFNRADAWGNPSRNYDNWSCDSRGFGRGYGVVLDDGTGVPQQYVTQVGGLNLNGAFTLWIRRPVKWQDDTANSATLVDYVPTPAPVPGNGVLVLVAEGVAPYSGGVADRRIGESSFFHSRGSPRPGRLADRHQRRRLALVQRPAGTGRRQRPGVQCPGLLPSQREFDHGRPARRRQPRHRKPQVGAEPSCQIHSFGFLCLAPPLPGCLASR